jgi:N-acetylglucosamine kinase-like BadF-type ATPase
MSLLLAVEGTGGRTQALLAEADGKNLARGFGNSSNPHVVGFEEATKSILVAVEGALVNALGSKALATPSPWRSAGIAAACLGLGGLDSAEDETQLSRWAKEQGLAERVVVVNDAELVIAGGTPDGWGVALICGVGSVCVARSPEGKRVRVGGWGSLLGDEGSGYQLALSALHLATQSADGRADASGLLQAILDLWKLREPAALINHVHAPTMTQAEIARVAGVVIDLVAKGDAHARRLVETSAAELALQVDTAVRRLGMSRTSLALGGQLVRGDLKRALLAAIKSEISSVAHVPDPCRGAITLAQRLLGQPPR